MSANKKSTVSLVILACFVLGVGIFLAKKFNDAITEIDSITASQNFVIHGQKNLQ